MRRIRSAMAAPVPVSVVIPAYNAGAFIARALASVARQTAPPAEVVVIDDGSRDDTAAIARAAGARVISRPNGGVASARNLGIARTSEPWLAFLDADDTWREGRLERQFGVLATFPDTNVIASDYTYCAADRVLVASALSTFAHYRSLPREPVAPGVVRARRADLGTALAHGNLLTPSTLLVHRRVFDTYGVHFAARETLPDGGVEFLIGEDYEWALRLLRTCDVLFIEEPLVDYRRTPGSLSANGGKLTYGDVVLGDLIAAAPERYVEGVGRRFAELRREKLLDAGSRFVRLGEIDRAYAMFEQAARAGDARARILAAAALPFASTVLGRASFARAVDLWRDRIRPWLKGR